MSYLNCLELEGPEKELVTTLSRLSPRPSNDLQQFFTKEHVLNGQAECETVLYHPGKYPKSPIGPVRFLWKPKKEEDDSTRVLWLWAHPGNLT